MSLSLIAKLKKKSVDLLLKKKNKQVVDHDHDLTLMRRVQGRRFPRWGQILRFKKVLNKKERLAFNLALLLFAGGLVWLGMDFVVKNRIQVPAVGGEYTEAVVGSPQLINPIYSGMNDVDADLSRLVYSGLMRYDEKQRLITDLAAAYQISEDKLTYTFQLKKDVLWHDREPFTARDVAFTVEAIQDPNVGSPLLVTFQGVDVQVLDDYTIRFTLSEPFAPFLSTLTVGILPEHIWAAIPAERMKLARQNWQPVGTGPFLFSGLSKDDTGYIYRYRLNRFEGFYRQPPYIEEVVFEFFSDYSGPAGAIEALREQRVDGLNFVPADLKEKVQRKHIMLHTLRLPQYTALFFNQNLQPTLSDIDLRTALAYAIDKDRIMREVLQGDGQVIYSPILPGFPGFNPEIEKTPYSIDKANELLNENYERVSYSDYRQELKERLLQEWEESYRAQSEQWESEAKPDQAEQENLSEQSDDQELEKQKARAREEAEKQIDERLDQELNQAQTFFRKDENGDILELNLVTADTREYQSAANLIAGFWQEIGIKTNLNYVSAKNISREVLKGRNYDILLYGEIVGSDPDQYPFWHSSQKDYPGLNLSSYSDKEVDQILERARETVDDDELVEFYIRFQDKILEDRPAIFLYMPTYTYAMSDKVRGFGVARISSPSDRFADVCGWYIKTDGRWDLNKDKKTETEK